ncbi:MAG: tetratricopeptide repeat protein [Planctomycetota bacterium]|nr:MAG: tetratricopeptide repeat protein [Planctomycetota bacterium]
MNAPPPAAPAPRARTWPVALLVAALAAACFAPSIRGAFVYDDLLLVERNPVITSFRNLPQAFSSAYWDFLDAEAASRIGYWRPLTAVALMTAHALGGGQPWAFHAVSIALHAAAAAAAFALLLRITRNTWIAGLGALLWAVHPLHVESVAWISSVNDPLSGIFILLALERHRAWVERGASGLPWAAAACFALGVLGKEMAATMVPCALALDLAGAGRGGLRERLAHWRRAWIPYAAVCVAYWLARVGVFHSLAAGFDRSTTEFGYPAARMAWIRVEVLGGALELLAFPLRLALFRVHTPALDWSAASTWIALGACVAWLGALVLAWLRRAWTQLAWLLFLVASLAPLLARIESLGQFLLCDRFLYVSCLAVVGLVATWERAPLRARAGLLALLAVAASALSLRRIPVWASEQAMFERAIVETPESPYPWWSLGRVRINAYRKGHDTAQLEGSLRAFERAQDLCERALRGDGSVFATRADVLQSNLGVGYCLLYEAEIDEYRDWETPRKLFENIAAMRPDSELPLVGLALVASQRGEFAESERLLAKALSVNPRSAEAQRNLGVISMQQGKWEQARRAFEGSLALRPGNLDDRVWIARALFQEGWSERAEEVAESARRAFPREAEPVVILAALARGRGDSSRALGLLDEALRLDSKNAFAHYVRGQVLYAANEHAAALEAFRRACDLDTTSFDYHYNLGALLLQTGARATALPFLQRAYAVGTGRPQLAALREVFAGELGGTAEFYYALALSDNSRGERETARAWVERALALDARMAPAHYLRGVLMKLSGDKDGAIAEFRWLAENTPDALDPLIELAALLLAQRRGQEAVPYYERALELVARQQQLDERQREFLRQRLEAELAQARAIGS